MSVSQDKKSELIKKHAQNDKDKGSTNIQVAVLNVQLGESNLVGITDLKSEKKLIKKVDVLGREGSENSLQIQIFDDGSTLKIFNNKNK